MQLFDDILLARFVAHTKVFIKLLGVSKDIWGDKPAVELPSSTVTGHNRCFAAEIVTYLA